jgi:hypothetical protein
VVLGELGSRSCGAVAVLSHLRTSPIPKTRISSLPAAQLPKIWRTMNRRRSESLNSGNEGCCEVFRNGVSCYYAIPVREVRRLNEVIQK